MKRPTWATVTGVLGIVFSSFGILRGGQTMLLPWILEFQKEIFGVIAARVESSSAGLPVHEGMARILGMFWGNLPSWFGAWSVAAGAVSMLVCGFCLYASIALLLMRPGALRMFYGAFGAAIALNFAKGIVFGATFSLMGLAMAVGCGFGLVVDAVLLLVVLTSDKSAFRNQDAARAGVGG